MKANWPFELGLFVLIVANHVLLSEALHLRGKWNTGNFFTFLAKFGFQKTDPHDSNTLGHIYGNITSHGNDTMPRLGTLVVVDRQFFLEFYGNRSVSDKQEACERMFRKIDTIAYDRHCNEDGTEDFLRSVPCPDGELCIDEDTPQHVVPEHQFTYSVHDSNQERFWYISLVACHRNPAKTSCNWTTSMDVHVDMSYDIWLVNGNPATTTRNPFEFQFSFDEQDTVEMYIGFFVLYVLLVTLQVYATIRQRHLITGLFTSSVVLQLFCFFFILIHKMKFSMDGMGVISIGILGDVISLISQSLFMLLLLLLAKGWTITRPDLTWKPLLFCIWVLYTCVGVLLYIWNMTEVDVIEDIDEYQTFPGWMILIFRLIIMVWFLRELRSTMLEENDQMKLRFYLDFGAGILVWFIYLPVVALIALNISALWRQKLLLGITSSADFLVYATMTHLLWPTRSQQYFQLLSDSDPGEELEEFNEAPHNIDRPDKECDFLALKEQPLEI